MPWWHWVVAFAIAAVLTAILFTRCCGQMLGPVALLLIFPYLLGSLLGGASEGWVVGIGFAAGLGLELSAMWWLVRAALVSSQR